MTEGDLKQEIKEYLDKEYCCEFKEECKDGIRIRCAAYEAKLYLILRFVVQRKKSFIDGYNEGLKAKINFTTISDCPIKFKWHDLRKNPADLPDLKNKYSSKVVITDKGHVAYYDYCDGLWYDFDFDYELESEVIAWCYFPSFEEGSRKNDKRSS